MCLLLYLTVQIDRNCDNDTGDNGDNYILYIPMSVHIPSHYI